NGNGTFAIRPDAGNQGGAFWTSATTGSAGTWVPDTYTLSFTDPATWTVTDSDNNVVATGSYVSGGGISFNGVSLVLEGEHAAGSRQPGAGLLGRGHHRQRRHLGARHLPPQLPGPRHLDRHGQ